jgi:uncharacterized protein
MRYSKGICFTLTVLKFNRFYVLVSIISMAFSFNQDVSKFILMAENNMQQTNGKSIRGFAAMSAEKQKEIASKGGRAAHQQGVAHEWSTEEARAAGKKGGQARGRQNNREGIL